MAQTAGADVEHIFTDLEFSQDFEVREEAREELERRIREAPVDTRAALASFQRVADAYQERVIQTTEQTIRLVAPAGSGKTQTVVNRVLRRIGDGLNPERLLLLTFDNSAASSLRNSVIRTIGQPVSGLRIFTLNAFGYGILRDYFPEEHKQVIRDYRPRRLLKEVKEALQAKSADRYAALPTNVRDRFYLEFFSLLKNSLFDPRDLEPQALADFMLTNPLARPFFPDPTDREAIQKGIQAVIWLYMAYERAMQRDRVLDFDDQKLRAYRCLIQNTPTLRILQGRLDEVIVDEFQDINLLDFVFIKGLAPRATLVVVGDDDQAIYGFRGCTPDFIIDLEQHVGRPVASFELQVNYRCPPNIVDHADKLIRHNTRRIPKHPIAHSQTPSQIKVVSSVSAALEAKAIVAFILRVKKAYSTLDFNDFAVLYRTNAQSLPLQVQFILNDIPYYVRERDNILSNEVLDRLLGVLRLKLALGARQIPTSRDAVLTIRSYFRFVHPDEVVRLERLFARREDFFETVASDEFLRILPFARESHLISGLREVAEAGSLMDTLDILTKRFRGLRGMIGSLEDVLEDQVPLGEVYELAADFNGNVADFVRTMDRALERAKATEAGKQEDAGVKLLTYFKSKGLQWHTVILTTCNEGLIPHKKAAMEKGGLESERRLFYVALTRSSANLLISYVQTVCGTAVAPSRFLLEAGLL